LEETQESAAWAKEPEAITNRRAITLDNTEMPGFIIPTNPPLPLTSPVCRAINDLADKLIFLS
jgi:hypothetical protein